jgi:predicted phage terminase large subunit-like protein
MFEKEFNMKHNEISKNGWTVIRIPCIAEEDEIWRCNNGKIFQRKKGEILQADRENPEMVKVAKKTLGSMNFAAQYQQLPVPENGEFVQKEWFRYFERNHLQSLDFEGIVISCDTAMSASATSDYSAICVFFVQNVGERRFYLENVVRGKYNFNRLENILLTMLRDYKSKYPRYPVFILMEDTAMGKVLLDSFYSKRVPFYAYKPRDSKQTRFNVAAQVIEEGNLILLKDAPWLFEYEKELLRFPHGRYDDQVDASSQALIYRRNFPQYFIFKYSSESYGESDFDESSHSPSSNSFFISSDQLTNYESSPSYYSQSSSASTGGFRDGSIML